MKHCKVCNTTKEKIEFPIRKYKSGNIGTEPNCFECKRILHRDHNRKKRATKEGRLHVRKLAFDHRRKFPEKSMLKSALSRARKRGHSFNITIEDIVITEVCPLLNIPMSMQLGGAGDTSPSLDRIDTTQGYVKGNVRVISRLANIMKAHATKEQLILFSQNILPYIGASPSDNKTE